MSLLFRSEFRKLALRPLSLLLLALIALGTLFITWSSQDYGFLQWHAVINSYDFTLHYGECAGQPVSRLAQCQADSRTYDLPHAAYMLTWGQNIAKAAAPGQQPIGAFGWAAGLLGSVPGVVVVFVLAAVGVAAEWERGTITPLLLAESRLGRVLLAKGLAVWTLVMSAVLAMGVLVILFDEVAGSRTYPLGQLLPNTTGLVLYTLRRLAGAALVTGLATAIATVCAVHWRSRGPLVAAGMALAVGVNLASAVPALWAWTPGGLIAQIMAFSTQSGIWDHAWGAFHPSSVPLALRCLPWVALLVWAGVRIPRTLRRMELLR